MQENLKVTHYRNGDAIPNVTDNTQWSNLTTAAYCNYNNDINNVATYGRLYNWYAVVDNRNLCPTDWHTPTDDEWTILTDYLGGETIAGGKMKEIGTTHWLSPNTGATNESGFTALPGGYRSYYVGSFDDITYYAYFWSATEYNSLNAWNRNLDYGYTDVFRYFYDKMYGFSVRCVKDSTSTQINDINYKENFQIYPNPTTGIFTIKGDNIKSIEIINLYGQIICNGACSIANIIDLSNQPKGIYFVKIRTFDFIKVEIIIIN